MHFLKDTTWSDVFAEWRAHEATNPAWIQTATAVKGWPDWQSWRSFTADQLRLPSRTWTLQVMDDPMREIPAMLVGPYTGWQSRLPQLNVKTFAELVAIPAQAAFFRAHETVPKLQASFPAETQFIGLRKSDGQIVCVEGHHRAVAVALAARDERPVTFGTVRIALADLRPDEGGLLDAVLARGSEKSPKRKRT